MPNQLVQFINKSYNLDKVLLEKKIVCFTTNNKFLIFYFIKLVKPTDGD